MEYFLQVRYLGSIGGKDVAETTRRIMRSLFADAVAICMNFAGRGGKLAIGGTRLLKVIIGMISLCHTYKHKIHSVTQCSRTQDSKFKLQRYMVGYLSFRWVFFDIVIL